MISIGNTKIGGEELIIMAGPCAIEDENTLVDIAIEVKKAGAKILRGGAFKPRTSPHSFQGLGERGLKIMARVAKEYELLTVTEAIDPNHVDMVAEFADIIQIGSRNVCNYPLLKKVGKTGKPILLKRGPASDLDEFLASSEYILNEGNKNLILCERGIKTFCRYSRNTLDLNFIPAVKEKTSLPVIVDPSHGTGKREYVAPMAKAAIAAGADGIIIEVHIQPDKSKSDAAQTISTKDFSCLMKELKALSQSLGKTI